MLRIEKSRAAKILLSTVISASVVIFTRSSLSRSLHMFIKFGVIGSSTFAAMRRQPTARADQKMSEDEKGFVIINHVSLHHARFVT